MLAAETLYVALFALAFLPLGFLIGCLVSTHFAGRSQTSSPAGDHEPKTEPSASGADLLMMQHAETAFRSFCAVTDDLHRDVGRHKEQIAAAGTSLAGLPAKDVERAVARIIEANAWLQDQLLTAQATIKHQQSELEHHILEANSDGLTGIGNRRAFDLELARQLSLWQRYGTEFSLIMFDIDRFKDVNDQHGHPAGDAVLRTTARLIRENLREVDFAARYGGEEFAAILPDTDHHGALMAGDRIRKAIAEARIPWEDKQLSITVSVGIAGLSLRDDAAALVRRADEALYISKRAGRNRTTLASHTPQADEISAAAVR
jgi:diguanylate cyclase (GGDEF)-like protein